MSTASKHSIHSFQAIYDTKTSTTYSNRKKKNKKKESIDRHDKVINSYRTRSSQIAISTIKCHVHIYIYMHLQKKEKKRKHYIVKGKRYKETIRVGVVYT